MAARRGNSIVYLKDGAYPQMDSLLIGEKYEQFNEKGENVSRTVIF